MNVTKNSFLIKMKEVIAIDIGGTRTRVAVVKQGKILKIKSINTPKDKKTFLKELKQIISSLINQRIKGIGISIAGAIDSSGKIIDSPNVLATNNLNLKKELRKFRKKVAIENDANCVALAESKYGVKKKNFIILTLGTGIGGGVIINGKLFKGQGLGGELGHIIINNGKQLEELIASKALARLTKKYLGKSLSIYEFSKYINKPKAKPILNELSKYTAQGIASLIDIFDPEIVVLAGGMRKFGNNFLNQTKKQVPKYHFIPRKTPIKWSSLSHPGIIGASLLLNGN